MHVPMDIPVCNRGSRASSFANLDYKSQRASIELISAMFLEPQMLCKLMTLPVASKNDHPCGIDGFCQALSLDKWLGPLNCSVAEENFPPPNCCSMRDVP